MSLQFLADNQSTLIRGKTFGVKEIIKSHGGSWDSATASWRLPIDKDTPTFRTECANHIAEEQKIEKARRAAERAYAKSPEGKAVAYANERAIIKRMAAQRSSWICCEDCVVISWERQITSCQTCAVDNGLYKDTVRLRGAIYTGD